MCCLLNGNGEMPGGNLIDNIFGRWIGGEGEYTEQTVDHLTPQIKGMAKRAGTAIFAETHS